MLISAIVASVLLFAPPAEAAGASAAAPAPQAAPASDAAKPASAEAKPELKRVCELVDVANSRTPQKKCHMVAAHE